MWRYALVGLLVALPVIAGGQEDLDGPWLTLDAAVDLALKNNRGVKNAATGRLDEVDRHWSRNGHSHWYRAIDRKSAAGDVVIDSDDRCLCAGTREPDCEHEKD